MRISSQISRFFGDFASGLAIALVLGFASAPARSTEDAGFMLAANRPGLGVQTAHDREQSKARKEREAQEAQEDQQAEEAGTEQKPGQHRVHRKRTSAPPASSRRPGTGRQTGQEASNSQKSLEMHEQAAQEYRAKNGDQPLSAPGNAQRPGYGVRTDSGVKRASLREILGLKKNRVRTAEVEKDKPKSRSKPKVDDEKAATSSGSPKGSSRDESAAQQFDPDADQAAHMHYKKSDGSDSGDESNRGDSPPAMEKQAEDNTDTQTGPDASSKESAEDSEIQKPRKLGMRRPSMGR